ncbi:hypothetical protein AB0K60_20780 [Thermopolyspora sp. NPDC052614]|uniref:hypothetical protein n=1 Tax=Thermopolyspora sp. NPDC052614 TaxID=3155682 RepID=UPI003440D101
MTCEQQIAVGPISQEAARGNTREPERTVLVVVHYFTAATRLMDILPLIESDHRVQVVYTVPPASIFSRGAHDYLRDTGALVIPWWQATQRRFDLILAAGQGLLEHLHGPIMMFPHGAGPTTYSRRLPGDGPAAPRRMNGLGLRGLVVRGRVVPSAIMLAHEEHRRLLAEECPEAVPATVVAGDLCFDRLLASRPYRTAYRNALGAGPAHKVLVVTSHWGKGSLFHQRPDLLRDLAASLPAEDFRIAAIVHPHVWVWHGRRQVHAWLTEATRSGIVLLPPEEGWRAALIAADLLIGDRGSVTRYGAALGLPVLLAPCAADRVIPGTQFALLNEIAPRIDFAAPPAAQLDAAERAWTAADAAALRSALTSVPGQAAAITRGKIYHLLGLAEPAVAPLAEPVPAPLPLESAAR